MVVMIFHPPFLFLGLGLAAFSVGKYVYSTLYKKKQEFSFKKLGQNLASLAGILFLIYVLSMLFGGWGIPGLLLIVVVLTGVIIYKRKETYMEAMRDVETQIWGKPLDRKEWKGQKPPRIKLVWRRKNMKSKVNKWLVIELVISMCIVTCVGLISAVGVVQNCILFGMQGYIITALGYLVGAAAAWFFLIIVPLKALNRNIKDVRSHGPKARKK